MINLYLTFKKKIISLNLTIVCLDGNFREQECIFSKYFFYSFLSLHKHKIYFANHNKREGMYDFFSN